MDEKIEQNYIKKINLSKIHETNWEKALIKSLNQRWREVGLEISIWKIIDILG